MSVLRVFKPAMLLPRLLISSSSILVDSHSRMESEGIWARDCWKVGLESAVSGLNIWKAPRLKMNRMAAAAAQRAHLMLFTEGCSMTFGAGVLVVVTSVLK